MCRAGVWHKKKSRLAMGQGAVRDRKRVGVTTLLWAGGWGLQGGGVCL